MCKIESEKTYSFDNIFWSLESNDPRFSKQEDVYNCLGPPLVDDAFRGLNCCIFAYGQTGSGKTYTMFGRNDSKDEEGIIPRLCHDIFEKGINLDKDVSEFHIVVSYMEIYNEKVFDLLNPKA